MDAIFPMYSILDLNYKKLIHLLQLQSEKKVSLLSKVGYIDKFFDLNCHFAHCLQHLNMKNLEMNYPNFTMLLLCAVTPWSLAAMQIALVLVILATGYAVFIEKKRPVFLGKLWMPLVIYGVLLLLSAIVSDAPLMSLKSVFQNEWVLLAVPVVYVAISLSSNKSGLVHTLLISAVLVAVYGFVQFFMGIEFFRGKHLAQMGNYFRATGGYSFYLTFAGNQLMAFALAFGFLLKQPGFDRRRFQYAAMCIVILVSIFATFARSTWLAFGLISVLAALMIDRKYLLSLGGFAIIAGIFAALLFPEIRTRFASIFDPAQNETRFNLWLTSLNMIKAHPIFGIGPGFFRQLFETYKVPGFYDTIAHAHNDYLNLAANSGIPALLGWIWLWVIWFRQCWTGFSNSQTELLNRQIIAGAMLAIAGILFAALFQCYYTDLENNIFWWLVAVLGYQASVEPASVEQ